MLTLETPLSDIPSIRTDYRPKLAKLGIETAGDLLRHLPYRYADFSGVTAIGSIEPGTSVTIEGTVDALERRRSWKKKLPVTEAVITDATGSIRAIWFGQRYIENVIGVGKSVRISGKASDVDGEMTFSSPAFERSARVPTHTGALVPTYPETFGVTSKWIRWQIRMLLESEIHIEDAIPEGILRDLHLPILKDALRYIHFPKTEDHRKIAEKRFAFEEVFLLQVRSLQVRSSWSEKLAVPITSDQDAFSDFARTIPFELTRDQQKAVGHILADIAKRTPMNRLLNGDVGSGKTVVALLAMYAAAACGYQSAILAPTEVLALQHFRNFRRLLSGHPVRTALLTHSYRLLADGSEANEEATPLTRMEMLKAIRGGDADIIVGTHALLQKHVRFRNLALVVVDEQHRFGVKQRAYLQQKASEISDGIENAVPHFLTMTATPIPRTLAIAFFGNLDISVLETMPAGRKPVTTKVVPKSQRDKVYEFIRSEIRKGRQAFVILPLVEQSETLANVKNATEECERLAKDVFPECSVGLLHGRLKSDEKESVMRDFKGKKLDILVATSVIEVGIDVPNATIILIENAERFGLSQLHQFRGRVGRSELQSYCFLFAGSASDISYARLKALESCASGFDIAQKDLELRGPGEFFGSKQSGLPDVAMENMANIRLVSIAREKAENLLAEDPALDRHPILKRTLAGFERDMHLE